MKIRERQLATTGHHNKCVESVMVSRAGGAAIVAYRY